jgi:hypothetical protein
MLGLLWYYEVPQMASQKNKAAGFKALLATFRQVGAPPSSGTGIPSGV